MHPPKMLAMKITKDRFPIACALLPHGIMEMNFAEELDGRFVILNSLGISYEFGEAKMCLSNCWMEPEDFENLYIPIEDPEALFFEVMEVPQDD